MTDKYIIEYEMGSGAQGTAYKVRGREDGANYVLKSIFTECLKPAELE